MVSINNLNFSYFVKSKNELLKVIEKFSFAFVKGKLTALIGPSGCGKTTLLKLIGDLIEPDAGIIEGTILINGLTPGEVRKKRGYGIAFQHPVLLPWLNVIENVTLPLSLPYQERGNIAQKVLQLVRMEGKEKLFPHELSGGMMQRVNLARALCHNPRLLLLDEPFGALDAYNRYSIMGDLYTIHRDTNSTILLITHDLLEAGLFSDYVVLLSGPPLKILRVYDASLYNRPNFDGKIVNLRDIELSCEILQDIQKEGLQVEKR